MISYDYPLNERIRTLLRLEDLFSKAEFYISLDQRLNHHAALLTLFEILEVTSRADPKADLLQEMERYKFQLEPLRDNPAIDSGLLDELLLHLKDGIRTLHGLSGKVGQHLRENEWLMSIKQRTGIPGGVCEFDLPSYHYWLSQASELRRADLVSWLTPMQSIREGIGLVLRVLRNSGKSSSQVAQSGAYQQMLSGKNAQILRITMPKDSPYVPEISANRYAINIRFTILGGTQKPRAAETDIEFDLTLCSL